MQEFLALSGLVNGIVPLGFAVLIFLKNSKSFQTWIFILLAASLSVWGFSYWQWLLSTSHDEALFFVRLLSIGSLLIPLFFFHWVLLVLRDKKHKLFLILIYIVASIILSLSFGQYFITDVIQKSIFQFWPVPGVLYTFYLLTMYFGLILYSLYLLIKEYFKTNNESYKGRMLYVILGAVVGFSGGATNFFLWYDITIFPYGNIFVALFPLFLGYSIVKHRLFNAKAIATELLIFFILAILFVQIIYAESVLEIILRLMFFISISLLGYLLIKSVYKEIEARKEVEKLAKDLEKANVRLKELDRLKSEFVSIASHQLRSPLTSMKGYASMLLEGSYGKFPDKAKEIISHILESSNLMVDSVEDFLNVSRIEQGKMEYNKTNFDVTKLARTVVSELTSVAEKKNLKLSFKGDNVLMVNADVGKIKQVFNNLIDNSIKYTTKGSIEVSVSKEKENVRFIVSDTGVGISKETLEILFDKFIRARNAHKINVSGTGLGLYVAKQMVEAHDGKIWAESDGEGEGSTFIVELKAI